VAGVLRLCESRAEGGGEGGVGGRRCRGPAEVGGVIGAALGVCADQGGAAVS